MNIFRLARAVGILTATLTLVVPALSSEEPLKATEVSASLSGLHGFDFEIGEWTVHHRLKRTVEGGGWLEFDGTSSMRTLMDGSANVEDNTFNTPGGVTHGVALRAYDPKTGQWAIWWIDGRDPHDAMDPPVKGRFEDGIGTFYSDGLRNGKPSRTRFIWSNITPTSARWEEAHSSDAGNTWDTSWVMEFRRVGTEPRPAH